MTILDGVEATMENIGLGAERKVCTKATEPSEDNTGRVTSTCPEWKKVGNPRGSSGGAVGLKGQEIHISLSLGLLPGRFQFLVGLILG